MFEEAFSMEVVAGARIYEDELSLITPSKLHFVDLIDKRVLRPDDFASVVTVLMSGLAPLHPCLTDATASRVGWLTKEVKLCVESRLPPDVGITSEVFGSPERSHPPCTP